MVKSSYGRNTGMPKTTTSTSKSGKTSTSTVYKSGNSKTTYTSGSKGSSITSSTKTGNTTYVTRKAGGKTKSYGVSTTKTGGSIFKKWF